MGILILDVLRSFADATNLQQFQSFGISRWLKAELIDSVEHL
jgi:hypothetical protein